MKITEEFLKEKKACWQGFNYVVENKFIGLEALEFIKKLIEHDKLNWANWLIVRIMNYMQYVNYAVFAAEQVIDIFEKKYPDDKRTRLAIEDTKKFLENPLKENKNVADAYAAAADAVSAADAADAAYAASAYAAYAAMLLMLLLLILLLLMLLMLLILLLMLMLKNI
jgi:hypothetical protein